MLQDMSKQRSKSLRRRVSNPSREFKIRFNNRRVSDNSDSEVFELKKDEDSVDIEEPTKSQILNLIKRKILKLFIKDKHKEKYYTPRRRDWYELRAGGLDGEGITISGNENDGWEVRTITNLVYVLNHSLTKIVGSTYNSLIRENLIERTRRGTNVTTTTTVNSGQGNDCLLYTSPSPRDATLSRMPSSA